MRYFSLGMLLMAVTPTMLRAETVLYVSCAAEQQIAVLKLSDDGTLTEIERVTVDGAPGSMTVDPSRKFLFVSLRTSMSIGSFAIDSATGKLTPINKTRLMEGANAAFVATDHTGRWLISASYLGARVVVHALEPDGRIAAEPTQVAETAKTAHCVVISPSNKTVYVPHVAPNAVFQFRFDPVTGKLEDFGRAAGGREGAGPRHIALHPSGKFAFTSDESGSSITAYAIDADEKLSPIETVSTLPVDYKEKNTTAEVKVHPSGKFAWVSNRGHDSLAGFTIDAASGKPTALGQTPTEKTPRSFEIDPSGKYVFGAGEGSGVLQAYRLDPTSGTLTPTQKYPLGKSLTWVKAVELP